MIRTHREPEVLTVGVEGPATMAQSPAVQATASEELARGVRSLRVDLRDCTTIDSTFSGTLLAMKRDCDRVGGDLTLVSPSKRVLQMIHEMGLDGFYEVEDVERERGPWSEVGPTTVRPADLKEHIIEAHDELARLPLASNDFRTVVEELRKSVDPDPAPTSSERRPKAGGSAHA